MANNISIGLDLDNKAFNKSLKTSVDQVEALEVQMKNTSGQVEANIFSAAAAILEFVGTAQTAIGFLDDNLVDLGKAGMSAWWETFKEQKYTYSIDLGKNANNAISKTKELQKIIKETNEERLDIKSNNLNVRNKATLNDIGRDELVLDVKVAKAKVASELAKVGYNNYNGPKHDNFSVDRVKAAIQYVSNSDNKEILNGLKKTKRSGSFTKMELDNKTVLADYDGLSQRIVNQMGSGPELGTDFGDFVYYVSQLSTESKLALANYVELSDKIEQSPSLSIPESEINSKNTGESISKGESVELLNSQLNIAKELEETTAQIAFNLRFPDNPAELIDPGQITTLDTMTLSLEDFNEELQTFKTNLLEQQSVEFWEEQAEGVGSLNMSMADLSVLSDSVGQMFGASAAAIQQFAGEGSGAEMAAKSLAMAQHGLAFANGIASAAAMPFPMNIIAIATTVASLVSAFGSIGFFANGGIVGGSSYSGDRMLARVNSGEMILNKAQQSNLFDMINGGINYKSSGQVVVLGTRVRGKDLEITGNNYRKMQNKLG